MEAPRLRFQDLRRIKRNCREFKSVARIICIVLQHFAPEELENFAKTALKYVIEPDQW